MSFFPPTEKELVEIIKNLKAILENEEHQDLWKETNELLKEKEQELQKLIIQNNAL